ncbi:hypothetical protein LSTR_LSTR008430 [Laodelphax striatellus]|uniref:EamA domain-containing protein n=1 Tax=Laodelphax striatellus TaxID=195883 RepID=A0A482XUC8_LAOST|nr:hypothetical protein LSTR_LSTR008430 [Laodelphax striatellus]
MNVGLPVCGGTQGEDAEPTVQRGSGVFFRLRRCKNSCCSKSAKKIYYGVCVTVFVTASWVGATHAIKYLYFRPYRPPSNSSSINQEPMVTYNAPFFTTWFITNWTVLFFPLYFVCKLISTRCQSPSEIIGESIRNFRDKGFTAGRFLTRCSLFCFLWVGTNYMYVHSLRILLATDVMALFATNVSCVYLLSWVILHEQFVGVRVSEFVLQLHSFFHIVSKLCTKTLTFIVFHFSSLLFHYRVLFKKVIGDASYGQVALFFSLIGLLNAALLWPLCLTLYFTGVETLYWDKLPWPALLAASILSLVANLLGNFSVALTYDLFITLGLITAVPVSAALDVVLYGAHFAGMKLAGIILISVGFFLVMFPNNWPDYITRLLRNIILLSHSARWSRRHRHGSQANQQRTVIDYRTGYIRSHLRSPSGRVR